VVFWFGVASLDFFITWCYLMMLWNIFTKKPKVSIIVPVYNREDLLSDTLDSIITQSYTNFELIIVNDASTDNTQKIIDLYGEKDSRLVPLKNNKNKGRAGSINIGLDNAKGKYICFLDSDDLFVRDRLSRQVKFLDSNKDIDFIYGDYHTFREKGTKLNTKTAVEFNKSPLEILHKNSINKLKVLQAYKLLDDNKWIPSSSLMFRRNIIDYGIRFDENLRNSEDCDFNFQVIGAGFNIKRVAGVVYEYRLHEGQKSKNKRHMITATEYICKKLHKGDYFI